MRYVTYKRVSTKQQGTSGLGLEAQERDIQLYLTNYSEVPYEIIGEYTEVDSGANGNRPELDRAIRQAKEHGATLLVSKLDRLSRKVSFIASLMEDKELSFRVAQMPQADSFQLHIYAALAQQERDFISKRTKAALQEARRRGVALGANQKARETTTRKANDFANVIWPKIQALHSEGATLQVMADYLNELGVKTALGKHWRPTQVQNIIRRMV